MSELTAQNYWDELIDIGEAYDFTKLTPTGISSNYKNVFAFAEDYYNARMQANSVTSGEKKCNLPVVNGWHLFSDKKPTIGKYLDIEWNDGTTDNNIIYDGFNPNLQLLPVKWRACR